MKTSSFFLIAALVLAVQAATLGALGQPFICACGYVKFWEGDVLSSGNSQHFADWYSFTHILHGALFYLLLWLVAPRVPTSRRLLIALALEALWEVAENSPTVIAAYRKQALAQGYSGDSILNSLSDTLMMAMGFIAAARLPTRFVVTVAIAMEIALAFAIRDNLTLNILNFVHPIPAVTRWQQGA